MKTEENDLNGKLTRPQITALMQITDLLDTPDSAAHIYERMLDTLLRTGIRFATEEAHQKAQFWLGHHCDGKGKIKEELKEFPVELLSYTSGIICGEDDTAKIYDTLVSVKVKGTFKWITTNQLTARLIEAVVPPYIALRRKPEHGGDNDWLLLYKIDDIV